MSYFGEPPQPATRRRPSRSKTNYNELRVVAFPESVSAGESLVVEAPAFSDEDIALAFSERHGADFRFTAALGHWSHWDGKRWRRDAKLLHLTKARAVCRDRALKAAGLNQPKEAKTVASAKTVSAVASLARADERHAMAVDQWDANPWALNTQTGIVDLKTGAVRPHDRSAYCTSIAAAGMPNGGGKCDLWRDVLSRAMGGNQALVSYLQRLFGYCLAGVTTEHVMAFMHGTGANSKSVILNTVSGVIGDYARTAAVETFMDSKSDRHPTELAMLNGARLVVSIETEEGRRWSESKLKALTGGDKISARFMRGDFFEFTPQFCLVIAGNHRPSLRSVDEAIKRRMHLIPFNVTIPPKERDPDLTEKLKAEWPGILAWLVAGCLEWQRIGLAPPPEVLEATSEYLANEDTMAAWIEECCVRDAPAFELSAALYASFKRWCEKNGEYCGQRKQFVDKIKGYGVEPRRKNVGVGFEGLRLSEWRAE